jgi:hypothetical protein
LALYIKAAKGKDFRAVVNGLERTDYEQDYGQQSFDGWYWGIFSHYSGWRIRIWSK